MTTSEPQAALDPATTTTTINNMAPEQSSPARAFIDRLAATIPSLPTDTNYISLAIGYGRQAVQPAVQQWSSWTAGQRFIALCLLLPVIAGPAMTLAFFAPVIAVTVAAIYVALFGVEVGQLHYKEAMKEHFGVDGQPAISLDAFKKRAEELKVKAEGSQFAQKTMHYGSVAVGQVLFFTVVVLDYIIAGLVKASQMVTQQRQNVAGYKQKIDGSGSTASSSSGNSLSGKQNGRKFGNNGKPINVSN